MTVLRTWVLISLSERDISSIGMRKMVMRSAGRRRRPGVFRSAGCLHKRPAGDGGPSGLPCPTGPAKPGSSTMMVTLSRRSANSGGRSASASSTSCSKRERFNKEYDANGNRQTPSLKNSGVRGVGRRLFCPSSNARAAPGGRIPLIAVVRPSPR